jgi:hypothetical protein
MIDIYRGDSRSGQQFVSQCNKAARCKAAIQKGPCLTYAVYIVVFE